MVGAMTVRIAFVAGALLLALGCGGSGSETPPPMEPTAAELSNWRPPPMPAASAAPFEEQQEPDPKSTEVEEEPSSPRKRKRPSRFGE